MNKTISTAVGILIVVLVAGVAGVSVLFFSQDAKEAFDGKNEVATEEDLDLEEDRKYFNEEESTEDITIEQWEKELIEIANELSSVQELKDKQGSSIEVGIEEFPSYYRVFYKEGGDFGIYLYGVDIDKNSMEVIEEGFLD